MIAIGQRKRRKFPMKNIDITTLWKKNFARDENQDFTPLIIDNSRGKTILKAIIIL